MFKLQVNIPDELLSEIDKVAEEKYLTRTSIVTLLLAEGVQRCKANNSVISLADSLQTFNAILAKECNNDSN